MLQRGWLFVVVDKPCPAGPIAVDWGYSILAKMCHLRATSSLYHKIYLKYYGLCHLWQKLYLISSKYTLQFLLIARYYIKLIHGRLLLLYWQPNGLMSRLDRAALFLAGKKSKVQLKHRMLRGGRAPVTVHHHQAAHLQY
jgi:hypothetical protein